MTTKKKTYTAPFVETCLLLSGNILWGGSKPEPGAPARRIGDIPQAKVTILYV